MPLKVGELAKRTGLTVRTLHHYDAVGLLSPSARTKTGYRLYQEADVARLHAIQALRQLGLSLAEIQNLLANKGPSLAQIIEQQRAALEEQIAQAARLHRRLGRLKDRLDAGRAFDLAEWLATLELMTTYDKYFTSEELTVLREQHRSVESQWPPLIADVRAAMARGLTPESPDAQVLARRCIDLMLRMTGGNRALLSKWGAMRDEEPATRRASAADTDTAAFIRAAIGYRRALFAKYLGPEDMARLRAAYGGEWERLVRGARRLLDEGATPESPQARALLGVWDELLMQTSDGDASIRGKLATALHAEPLLLAGLGVDADIHAFIRRARRAATKEADEPG